MLDISSNIFDTKVTETDRDRTPKRTVGYDVSWDNIGPNPQLTANPQSLPPNYFAGSRAAH